MEAIAHVAMPVFSANLPSVQIGDFMLNVSGFACSYVWRTSPGELLEAPLDQVGGFEGCMSGK